MELREPRHIDRPLVIVRGEAKHPRNDAPAPASYVFTLRPISLGAGTKIAHCPAGVTAAAPAKAGRGEQEKQELFARPDDDEVDCIGRILCRHRQSSRTSNRRQTEERARESKWKSGGDFFQTWMRVTNRSLAIHRSEWLPSGKDRKRKGLLAYREFQSRFLFKSFP